MSAFLGPIHYWLFSKIRHVLHREAMLHEKATAQCGAAAEELQQQVWQSYGLPLPDKDLSEMIDQGNIHGWLQKQINIAETREAAFIREVVNNCGSAGRDLVRSVFKEHGEHCGEIAKQQGKYNTAKADEIYKAINDFYLNGMPCDQADMIVESSPEKVIWEGTVCLQEPNWKRAEADPELMKELYALWLSAFCSTMNASSSYRHFIDVTGGKHVTRHELIVTV